MRSALPERVLTGSLLLWFSVATAEEIPEGYTGIRPAGMGNAFTALSNDHNAIWTNPAGIARVRKARSRYFFNVVHFPNLVAGVNTEGRQFYRKLQASGGSKKSAESIQNILESLDELSQASIWARASTAMLSFFDVPRGAPWAFGLVTDSRINISRDSDDSSVAIVDSLSDFGAVLTLGATNRTNRLNAAVQLRPVYRFSYYDKLPVDSLVSFDAETRSKVTKDSNSGSGIGIDAGVMWTFADFWFPTVGLAIRNLPTGCVSDYLNAFAEVRQKVCGTKYGGNVNNPESPSLVDPMDTRIGLSMTPRLTHKMALRFAVDYHHIYFTPDNQTYYGLSGIEPLKQTHAGVELFFGNPLELNPFSLRVGFNQGFMTYGATIRMGVFLMEAAVYGRDISSGSSGKEDRRMLLSLAAEFR